MVEVLNKKTENVEKKGETVVRLQRFGQHDGKWKTLRVDKGADGSIFLIAEEGQKGSDKTTRIVFKLEEYEVALLSIKLGKLL